MSSLIILFTSLLIAGTSFADVTLNTLKGEIKSFDEKVVTVLIGGSEIKFDRTKLGKDGKNIKAGEKVEVDVSVLNVKTKVSK